MIRRNANRASWTPNALPSRLAIASSAGIALALVLPVASMAQVYKCPSKGGTLYQSTPCANDPKAPPHIAKPADAPAVVALQTGLVQPLSAGEIAAMDLHAIQQALLADDAARKRVEEEYRAAELAWQRTAGKGDPQERLRQSASIDAHRQSRLRSIGLRDDALNAELTHRCPLGATMSATRMDCKK